MQTTVDMTVMLAHVLDLSNKVRPVAYGVFSAEDGPSQRFFLQGLVEMVPDLVDVTETVFTDDRVVKEHVKDMFPNSQHCRCCFHLMHFDFPRAIGSGNPQRTAATSFLWQRLIGAPDAASIDAAWAEMQQDFDDSIVRYCGPLRRCAVCRACVCVRVHICVHVCVACACTYMCACV